jgi:hypothetical protein
LRSEAKLQAKGNTVFKKLRFEKRRFSLASSPIPSPKEMEERSAEVSLSSKVVIFDKSLAVSGRAA